MNEDRKCYVKCKELCNAIQHTRSWACQEGRVGDWVDL